MSSNRRVHSASAERKRRSLSRVSLSTRSPVSASNFWREKGMKMRAVEGGPPEAAGEAEDPEIFMLHCMHPVSLLDPDPLFSSSCPLLDTVL